MNLLAEIGKIFNGKSTEVIQKRLAEVELEISTRQRLLDEANDDIREQGALARLLGEQSPDRTKVRECEDALEELRTAKQGLDAALVASIAKDTEGTKQAIAKQAIAMRDDLARKLGLGYAMLAFGAAVVRRYTGNHVSAPTAPSCVHRYIEEHSMDLDLRAAAESLTSSLGADCERLLPGAFPGIPLQVDAGGVDGLIAAHLARFESKFAKEIGVDMAAARAAQRQAAELATETEQRRVRERAEARDRWIAAVRAFLADKVRARIPDEQTFLLVGSALVELENLGAREPGDGGASIMHEYVMRSHRGIHSSFSPDRPALAAAIGLPAFRP